MSHYAVKSGVHVGEIMESRNRRHDGLLVRVVGVCCCF